MTPLEVVADNVGRPSSRCLSHKTSLSPTSRGGRCCWRLRDSPALFLSLELDCSEHRAQGVTPEMRVSPPGKEPDDSLLWVGAASPIAPHGDRAPSCKWPPPWGQQGRA